MRRLDLQRFADTEAVQRYQEALYINVGAAGAAATYELFGTGVTKADESFDTKTKESRYINQKSTSQSIQDTDIPSVMNMRISRLRKLSS